MKTRIYLLFLIVLCTWMASCSPSYLPNNLNMPLLYTTTDKPNDLYLSASLSGEIQAAYAVADHIGVMANVLALPGGEDRYFLGEAGIGTFTTINDNFHLEIFGGGGYGSGNATGTRTLFNTTTEQTEQGKYWRYFVQPDVGVHTKPFELALGTRFSYVDYFEFSQDGMAPVDLPGTWLIEPSVALRFGFGGRGFFKNKKLFIQFTGILDKETEFETSGYTLGLGIVYRSRKY